MGKALGNPRLAPVLRRQAGRYPLAEGRHERQMSTATPHIWPLTTWISFPGGWRIW